MRPRWVATLIAGLCLTNMALQADASGAVREPPGLSVTARNLITAATLGSYCIPDPQPSDPGGPKVTELCVDVAYPLRTRSRLPVRPRRLMRIAVGTRARAVRARLLNVVGDEYAPVGPVMRAEDPSTDRTRWRMRLPDAIGEANVLSIVVSYPRGHANFWVGISDTASCRPRA